MENRNLGCSNPPDADGEICSLQNSASADVAKEFAQVRLLSFATSERGSRRLTLIAKTTSEKADESPLTSVLSPQAGRGETYAGHNTPRGRARTPKSAAKR